MAPEGPPAITNTTPFPVTCLGFSFSAGACVGCGGTRFRGAANAAESPWVGSAGSWTDGFQSLASYILILCRASTPLIQGGSRMRRRARTDLCGGRSVMIVPTATASPRNHFLFLMPNCLATGRFSVLTIRGRARDVFIRPGLPLAARTPLWLHRFVLIRRRVLRGCG